MNYERGSLWRKWDLHIHTPLSMINQYEGAAIEDKWEGFINDLESLPEEFKVIGINDYLFIDGYEKVLSYKQQGRLKNIETILPVIEFRIKKFAGHSEFKRINFHIIFSNRLSTDLIRQQFLNQLNGKHHLSPLAADAVKWGGVVTPQSLEDLGNKIIATVPDDKRHQFGDPLVEGFNNINFDEDEIMDILDKNISYLKGNYLTAIGKTEWSSFIWGDNSIAEKKSVINKVDFVFTSAETIDSFNNAKNKLKNEGVNNLLLDCSDAHYNKSSINKDRIGKCFTWIKADTTFEGLKEILYEPDRVCVAGTPELLERLTANPNKFITEIKIERVEGSTMPETWYDNMSIKLNPSLVAIIGNKGNGKSALTDILGLVGNSHNTNYSFLTNEKFQKGKPYNRAANTQAKIVWADSTSDGFMNLSSTVNFNKEEKVKYIPQNFLEKICSSEKESVFEDEIKGIIFSHIPASERVGFSTLDEVINRKSEIINKTIGTLKSEIDDINLRIISLEKKTQDSHRITIEEALIGKKAELDNHENTVPLKVDEPTNNPQLEERNKEINSKIIATKSLIDDKLKRQEELNKSKVVLINEINELEKAEQSFEGLKRTILNIYLQQEPIIKKFSLDIRAIFSYHSDLSSLNELLKQKRTLLTEINNELIGDSDTSISISEQIQLLRLDLTAFEDRLDEPFRLYQKYLKDVDLWKIRQAAIIGNREAYGTIMYYQHQLDYINNWLNDEIGEEYQNREIQIQTLFAKKQEVIQLYKDSYKPISDLVLKYGHLMKSYELNLSAEFTLDGFVEKFFDHVSQGAKGSYLGIGDGNKFLSEIIVSHDLNTLSGTLRFLSEIRESLFEDKRTEQIVKKRDVELQLKKGYSVEDLYSFLFSLDYLKPTFRLKMGDKALSELSPGERGALLLIFYLFLDKDDKPLIIDQPEENLDNQSVYTYLVHFIKEAKKHRQIIIVTHNPNLAVVCDAEQIIHMCINKAEKNKVSFKSGAIENPEINKTLVDILEGTKPALSNRTSKYSLLATN